MCLHALAPPVIMMAFGSFFGGCRPFFSHAAAGPLPLVWGQDSQSGSFGRISRLHYQDTTLRLCLLMWLPQGEWRVASSDTRHRVSPDDWQVSHLIRESVQTPYNAQSWMGPDPSIIDLCTGICIFAINPSIPFNIDFLPITVQKPASLHGNPRCQFHPLTLALHLSSSVF